MRGLSSPVSGCRASVDRLTLSLSPLVSSDAASHDNGLGDRGYENRAPNNDGLGAGGLRSVDFGARQGCSWFALKALSNCDGVLPVADGSSADPSDSTGRQT
jgi:hypothetical protein